MKKGVEGLASSKADILKEVEANASELIGILQDLVRVPSINGDEEECQELIVSLLQGKVDQIDVFQPVLDELMAHPAYTSRQERDFSNSPNVVALKKGTGGGRSLILNAHVDVVPPDNSPDWRGGSPWSGAIENGFLYGRGSCDTKPGLAITIYLLRLFQRLGVSLAGDVIFQSVVDEEKGGAGSLATIIKGYRADAAVIFEPTELEIHTGNRGGQFFCVEVKGKGAHPIHSYEGISAIHKAIKIIEGLRELEQKRNEELRTPLFERYPVFVPITIGQIFGDDYISKVPEKCSFQGLYGIHPQETIDGSRAVFEENITAACNEDPWLSVNRPKVSWLDMIKEGAETPAQHPLVNAFLASYQDALGVPGKLGAFTASCDLHYYVKYAGIPTIIFAPGNCTQGHTLNEHVSVQQVITAAKVVASFLIDWCKAS